MNFVNTPNTGYSPNKHFDLVLASEVSIADAGGYYTSDNVEGALQEIGSGGIGLWTKSGTDLEPATSTDNVDLVGGGVYKISNTDVLVYTSRSCFTGNAGRSYVSGSLNYGMGEGCLDNLNGGLRNNAWGYLALQDCTTGNKNNGMGATCLANLTTGEENCAVGNQSLSGVGVNPTGSAAIGYQAGLRAGGDYNVFIGYQAGYDETTDDNRLHIANNRTTTLIYGEFDTELVKINGTLNMPDDEELTFGNSDNTTMKWDSATSVFSLSLGAGATTFELDNNEVICTTTNYSFKPVGTTVGWSNFSYGGGTGMTNLRAQGSDGAEESIVNGAILNQYTIKGYHENGGGPGGGAYYEGGEIRFTVDGPIGASAEMPTRFELYLTPDGSTTKEKVLAIGSDKLAEFYGDVELKERLVGSKSVYTGTDTTYNVYSHVCDSATAFTLTLSDGSSNGEEIRIINRGVGTVTLSGKISSVTGTSVLYTGETIVLIWDVSDDEWQ